MSEAKPDQTIEPDRYAVVGNPIRHSKSPQIHAAFAAQTGQQMVYRTQLIEVGHFDESARAFFNNGGRGLNVTVPFKLDAFQFADELSGRARRAGAVNTLARQDDGSIYGDNTDGIGLVRDLHDNLGWEIADRRILLLGAGGAVRGILEPLLRRHPKQVVIANRTADKAVELAKAFADLATTLADNEQAINDELLSVQGQPVDIGGYYRPDEEKVTAVMRPSKTLNDAIASLG